jgi:hypothetical protein
MSPIANSYRSGPSMALQMDGIGASSAMLRDAAARGEDMRPAMARIRDLLIEGHKEQFATQGSFLGTPWPENSPETLARKARAGIPSLNSPMVASGDLEQSLSGGRGGRTRVSKGSVSVGTSLFYAIFAIRGASGGRRGSEPARPPLGINEAERLTSIRIMTDYLLGL